MNKYEKQELLESLAGLIVIAGPLIGLFILVVLSFF